MRTTLNVDDNILPAVSAIAAEHNLSLVKALSNLEEQTLTKQTIELSLRGGVPLFPDQPDSGVATLELVNRLRDSDFMKYADCA